VNSAQNDSTYASLSVRHGFGPSLDDGFKLRADVARGKFSFDYNGTVHGQIDTAHLLLGYSVKSGDSKVTFYGGVSSRKRNYDKDEKGLTDVNKVGAFASIEADTTLASGANLAGLIEYDSPLKTLYTSAYMVFPVGGILVGPTLNYLDEGDYSRSAIGLRLQMPVAGSTEFVVTGAYAEGGVDGEPNVNSSYLELQLSTRF
jgi:hypothetical protein